ncbi:uncharacterized protein [Macrobrachium rosenbergii]|uniref:uncharacterized protein isoform X2 n=1 Tax=Macrobrachium rosenbergii TaxID=79674 RepID=UPI0034D459CF
MQLWAFVVLSSILTWVHFAHSQDWADVLIADCRKFTNDALKGVNDLQQKQNEILENLHELRRDLDHVQGTVNNNQDSLQNFHQELEHVKDILQKLETSEGIHQKTKGCPGKEDSESFKNISSADMAECGPGKGACSPHATCRNSSGSYSCSCNPPFEGDGRTCEFSCKSPAQFIEGLGCVKLVEEEMTWDQMNATCQASGWRLLQEFQLGHLEQLRRTFTYRIITWIGMYDGKWVESGIDLPEELWMEGHQAIPERRRCGFIKYDSSSSSVKVTRIECSNKRMGFCQLVINP